jgi:phage/plasmid-like protein (TIGR03299 family)
LTALVGEAKAMYHTAGSLRGGQKVWIQAKLPEDLVVVRGDVVNKFLLLVNSHDGTTSMTCRFVTTRVVCQNTLNAALRERGAVDHVSVRHTGAAPKRVEEARRVLGIGLRYFEVFEQRCRAMSAKVLTERMLEEYFRAVVPLPPAGQDPSHVKRVHEVLAFLFEEGRGNQLPPVKGTLWAAYNAVTEYVDHVRGLRPDGKLRHNWAESALFGPGERIKRRAFDAAVALMEEGPLSRAWRRVRGGAIIPDVSDSV